MNVIRLHGAGDLRLHDEPVLVPGPGEATVRVHAVGVCGSDLHWFSEAGIGDARLERPLVLGHEAAGVAHGGGEGHRAEIASSEQRVAVDPAIPCGNCEPCLEGHPNLCTALRFAGHGAEDGALREFMTWPARCLVPLPASLSDADGAMLEPLGVAIHAVDLGQVRPGMTAGVFGCGPIGLLILQVARAAGATRLVATELPDVPHRLEAARGLGASVYEAAGGREVARVMAETNGRGVDVAFEAAGDNEAVEAAIAAVRPGGRVILAGIPPDDRTAFGAAAARRKGLTIKLVRRMQHTYPRAIRLVESGTVDVRSLVTHHFPLAEAARAFAVAQRREGIKVIVDC